MEQIINQGLPLEIHVSFNTINELCIVDLPEFIGIEITEQSADVLLWKIRKDGSELLMAYQMNLFYVCCLKLKKQYF